MSLSALSWQFHENLKKKKMVDIRDAIFQLDYPFETKPSNEALENSDRKPVHQRWSKMTLEGGRFRNYLSSVQPQGVLFRWHCQLWPCPESRVGIRSLCKVPIALWVNGGTDPGTEALVTRAEGKEETRGLTGARGHVEHKSSDSQPTSPFFRWNDSCTEGKQLPPKLGQWRRAPRGRGSVPFRYYLATGNCNVLSSKTGMITSGSKNCWRI